jgi:HK97 family phage major capsid protein
MEMKDFLVSIDEKMDAYKKGLAEQSQKAIDELKAEAKAAVEAAQKNGTEIKTLEETVNKLVAKAGSFSGGAPRMKSFEGELGEKLTEAKAKLAEFKTSKKGFSMELETKVVGNMGSSTNLTGSYFVPPTYVPGVQVAPYESIHVRDLLPKGTTDSNVVRYVVDNGGEGGPTTVAEAGTKPQIDRDLQIKDANVRKIATYFRVPEEMIEDISYLQSFLAQVGVEEVMAVEDNQILYGDGTGQNLSGFNTQGTAFAAGTSVIGASANNFDVIGAAKKQLRVAKFGGPLYALVNPVDYFDMRWKKDTANNYLFQSNQGVTPLQIDGVTILEHTAVTAGGFFVFSPRAAAIFDRAGTTVRLYDQDQDNAIKNLVTIVIEKRLALPVYYTGAIIRGTFSTAITDLTS